MTRILRAATAAALEVRPGTSDADCCVFVESALRRAYGSVVDNVPAARWRIIRDDPVWGSSVGPWEPVRAALSCGVALSMTLPPDPPRLAVGRWQVLQGWRGTPFAEGVSGHTLLVYGVTETHCLVVDSSARTGPQVPEQGPTSWAALVAGYRGGVAVAVLRPVGG